MRNVVADQEALERLVGAIRERSLGLSTFYHDTEGLSELLNLLHERGIRPHLQPSSGLPARCATRSGAIALLRENALPTLPGFNCESRTEVIRVAKDLERVLIKEEGKVPIKLLDAAACPHGLRFPTYVEQYVEVVSSPNIQWTSAGGLTDLMICDQIVQDFRHIGNRSMPIERILEEITSFEGNLRRICDTYQYEGPIGLDAVIDTAGRFFVVDLNPRFNSCTYPLVFLRNLGLSLEFIYEYVIFEANLLDDVFYDERFIRFGQDTEGSVIVGPAAKSVNGPTMGAFLLSVARSIDAVEQVHLQNMNVIAGWS